MIGETSFIATARLDDNGEPSIKVTASCRYGSVGRSAGWSEEITDETLLGAIADIFAKAIEQKRESTGKQAFIAAAEAAVRAAKNGEDV